MAIFKQNEAGMSVSDLCQERSMSRAHFYKWRAKFSIMNASMMKRLKELDDENKRLKKMYAEERIKADIRHEIIEGKL
jgi:putative transposase